MSKKFKEKEEGRLSKMYGNFVQVPYVWYKLCRKYEIPKEIAILKNKGNTIDLNPMEINVLAYLAGYENCYPTNKQMATLFQVGTSTIEKYLKELRWVGFIKTYEEKSEHTYTDRRKIYVQFDIINAVLESENNPYKCMVSIEDDPYECMDEPIHMNGSTHMNVWENPYTLATNKKELENIKKYNKENVEDKSSTTASDEAKQPIPIDLYIYKDITEQDVRDLKFNSKSHDDVFDDYEYVEKIYQKYIECCIQRKNIKEVISSVKSFMSQYNCDETAVETCIGYFLYQHRGLKIDIKEMRIEFE